MRGFRVDLGQARRSAKELLAAARRGEHQALVRMARRRDPLRLADAQLSIARELGYHSWPALVAAHRIGSFQPARLKDVDPLRIERVTLVPFTGRSDVVLICEPGTYRLPQGAVLPGEDALVHTTLRVGLNDADFRRQSTHLFALDHQGTHAAIATTGTRYHGDRLPHNTSAVWWTGPPSAAVSVLSGAGRVTETSLVELATESLQVMSDDHYWFEDQRNTELSYLSASSPQGGSGYSGTAEQWEANRSFIRAAIAEECSFLDIGCANGYLMESIETWTRQKNLHVTTYGLEISPAMANEARRRLPTHANRIWTGNAATWIPPTGLRFDIVYTLLDYVLPARRADYIARLTREVAAHNGRVVVGDYASFKDQPERHAARQLQGLGFEVAGVAEAPGATGSCAWIDIG